MQVGIRELKAHLSAYLDRVADGDTIVVTDRGRPVAEIVPVSGGSHLARGIEEGWVEAPRRTGLSSVTRHRASRSVLEVLDEDRG